MHCDTMGSPFGGYQNGDSVSSPLYACAQHSLSGGSRSTAATAKEDREKQSEEGGVARRDAVSGGQGPKPLEVFPVASGYGGYVR